MLDVPLQEGASRHLVWFSAKEAFRSVLRTSVPRLIAWTQPFGGFSRQPTLTTKQRCPLALASQGNPPDILSLPTHMALKVEDDGLGEAHLTSSRVDAARVSFDPLNGIGELQLVFAVVPRRCTSHLELGDRYLHQSCMEVFPFLFGEARMESRQAFMDDNPGFHIEAKLTADTSNMVGYPILL